MHTMVGHIIPVVAGREPHLPFCLAGLGIKRLTEHCGENIVPEEILLVAIVGLLLLRIVVIERATDGNSGVKCLTCSIIDIRSETVPEPDCLLHIFVMGRIGPDFPFLAWGRGRVGLENRSEDSILQPPGVHLRVCVMIRLLHVASYVVAPVAVAHVGSRGSEIRKHCECAPLVEGVS